MSHSFGVFVTLLVIKWQIFYIILRQRFIVITRVFNNAVSLTYTHAYDALEIKIGTVIMQ
jgi:hypothetical protein